MLSVIMLSVMALNLGMYYSQHFIFSVTYEWAHVVEVLHNTRLERLARIKHSSLLVSTLLNFFNGSVQLSVQPQTLSPGNTPKVV
jgi:hypothetical protein